MNATHMEFHHLPPVAPSYFKVIFSQRPGLRGDATIPRIEAQADNVVIDHKKLLEYRKLCGFSSSTLVPISYLHVLASPLHLQVLSAPRFPLKLLGLVHIRNSITQHKAIEENERMMIRSFVDGHRDTDKGIEFDLITEIFIHDECVWESTSTMLSRGKGKGKGKKSNNNAPSSTDAKIDEYQRWDLQGNLGRKYAKISGDFNPIHLYGCTAKLFGFKQPIIHGMWSLARAAAALEKTISYPVKYDVSFKLPVLLPNSVIFAQSENDSGVHFKLLDKNAEKPHLSGELIKL